MTILEATTGNAYCHSQHCHDSQCKSAAARPSSWIFSSSRQPANRRRFGRLTARFVLRTFLGTLLAGMIFYNLVLSPTTSVLSTSLAASETATAMNPCQVATDTAERLQRLENMGRRHHHRNDSFPPDWKPQLPKIVHHQWKDEAIPLDYKEWHEQWLQLFPEPEYKHMLWTDEAARTLIRQHYPWFLPIYDDCYQYSIQRADSARYFYLHHHGGIHTDLDYEPLLNFYKHLPSDRVGLVESPYKFNEEAQNSLMSSPKHDPFWHNVFRQLMTHCHKPILAATGPKLLDVVLQTTKHDVHLLPCENFHRIPKGESRLSDLPRDLYGKLYPMKQCGNYDNQQDDGNDCQFAKHHNTASYVTDFGFWDHVFNAMP